VPCRRPGCARWVVHRTSRPEAALLPTPDGLPGARVSRLGDLRFGHAVAVRLRRADTLTVRCWVDVRPVKVSTERPTVPAARNRRDPLLAAALDGFARRGYDATSVAELAAATDMSKAAVSYHFRTKNELLHALADPLLDDLDALVDRHPGAPRWPAGVRGLLEGYLTTLTDHRQVAAWVDSDKAVLNHPQIGPRLHRNTQRMCQAITGSAADGTAAAVRAMAALGSLWRPVRTLPPAHLAAHRDTLIHAAMAGCAPLDKTPRRAQTDLTTHPGSVRSRSG
jgi:AcrR family transcriptional regulator